MNHPQQHHQEQQQHQQQQQPDDEDQCIDGQKSPQCSTQDLFRYIDQQHATLMSQMESCALERKEVVREMAEHLLSFESASDEDDSNYVFQRHTELTMQLSGLQREQNKLKKKFESVKMLSDKRNVVEAVMRRRFKEVEIGGPTSFSIEELRQLIESQASATLEVEILNQERTLLEIQLKEAKKQTERLQIQCSEKDERINLLKEQNLSYQHELAHLQSESPVSSQVSIVEMTKISKIQSNLKVENEHLRRRITSFATVSDSSARPNTPPSTVQISRSNQPSTPQQKNSMSTNLPDINDTKNEEQLNQLAKDIKGNLRGDEAATDEDVKRKDEEKKLRQKAQHLRDEATKEKERFLREKFLKHEDSEEVERKRIEQQKLRQQQQRERWTQDEAAKEEERRIREVQEQQQAAMQAHEDVLLSPSSHEKDSGRQSRSLLSSIPEAELHRRASLEITNYQRQSTRQAQRMASRSALSPTPSTQSSLSRSSHDDSSQPSDPLSKAGSLHGMARSAHGGMPGAMRMAANGNLQSDSDDESDASFEDDGSDLAIAAPEASGSFTVTATLVRESGAGPIMTERERLFLERERELEEREAEIAKQSRSFQSLTATAEVVPAVATAVATVQGEGGLGRSKSVRGMGMSRAHLWQSSRTTGEDSLMEELDAGPMRFHPMQERSLRNQFLDISDKDYECFQKLQTRWEKRRQNKSCAPYSETIILRFLRNTCRKDGSFNLNKAWKAMKKTKERNLFLSADKLEEQLLTATLFPVPGLFSLAGFEMFYMKPCRFHRKDSVKDVINNLVYVMNCMLEKEGNSKNGIGFMACMNDWKMVNFEVNYCYQFMMALQALVVPVAVELFLIVNPPSWFGGIWKIMKPMLAPSFRKKVKVIKEDMLGNYLVEGYQQYLPDDLATGTVDTFQLAQDFVTYRKHSEIGNVQLSAKSATIDEDGESQFSSSDGSIPKAFRGLDSSYRSTATSSDGHFGSSYGSSSNEIQNEDDDASIHCSIDGDVEDMLEI